jgi:hypothetical protein
MKSSKLTILKSPDTEDVEVAVYDSVYAMTGKLYIIPEGTELIDPSTPYREYISQLEYELEKAKRGKNHIMNNLRNSIVGIK